MNDHPTYNGPLKESVAVSDETAHVHLIFQAHIDPIRTWHCGHWGDAGRRGVKP